MATQVAARNGARSNPQGGTSNRNRSGGAGRKAAARKRPSAAARASAEPLVELEINETRPLELPQTRVQRVAGTLKEAGSTVGGAIAGHAVPAALIGAGLAWLLLESGPAQRRLAAAARRIEESELLGRARETFGEVSERVGDRAESLKESFRESFNAGAERAGETWAGAAESVREGASRLGEYTQDGARAVRDTLRTGATTVGEGARQAYEYSRQGAAKAWRQHPLSTGLAALAAGVAVGMLLPGTRREDETLGETSDAVSRRVRAAGRTLVERGKQVASTAAEALRREAEGEGLGASEVTRKVRRIAHHVKEATVSASRRARLDPASVLAEAKESEQPASRPAGQNGTRSQRKR